VREAHADVLRLMEGAPFDRLLGIRGDRLEPGRVDFLEPARLAGPLRAEACLLRRGNRVCHVRVSVTQDGVPVAEGSAVYNIHRRKPEG
jgi:acyl-coenzyme A thioesterase PaaI-like protein